ncbi:MAG: hypothetical protein M3N47_12660 [Chloroflexota bacterium]|nr:hypothetical protein [Chloroflexota bacterium]
MVARITGRRQQVSVVKDLQAVVDFFEGGDELRLKRRDDGHASAPSVCVLRAIDGHAVRVPQRLCRLVVLSGTGPVAQQT